MKAIFSTLVFFMLLQALSAAEEDDSFDANEDGPSRILIEEEPQEAAAPSSPAAEEPPPSLTGEWGGVRTKMRDNGFEISSYLVMDDIWDLHGGESPGPSSGGFEYLFDLNLKVTSEPLFHYPGGTFLVDFESHRGHNSSAENVGSLIAVDAMEAPPYNALFAFWYKQVFGEDRFWFLVGKSDAYDNFSSKTHCAFFLNSGFTFLPTILFFPTSPEPAMSAIASLRFIKGISATFGVFDGSLANGFRTGQAGIFGHFFNHLTSHAFLIGEADFQWAWGNYVGRLGIGAWGNTANFKRFNGTTKSGTGGPYLTFDQIIYKPADEGEEASVFFIYGSANPSLSLVHRYFGAGFVWQGIMGWRMDDLAGFAMGYSALTSDADVGFKQSHETVFEFLYQWHITPWVYFQPDFQYVVHPGGEDLPNASVLLLRLFFKL